MVAVQNTLSPEHIPTAMATFVFCQDFGAALMTVIAQTIFTNGLKTELAEHAPTLDARAIISAGSTAMRSLVSGDELPSLLSAYSEAVASTFYLATATSLAAFFVSYLMGWKDIRQNSGRVGVA